MTELERAQEAIEILVGRVVRLRALPDGDFEKQSLLPVLEDELVKAVRERRKLQGATE